MMLTRTMLFLALLATAATAQAQSVFDDDAFKPEQGKKRHYTGFNVSLWKEYDFEGLTGFYGYDFSNWFSVEGHLGTTNSQEDPNLGAPNRFRINVLASALARVNLRFGNAVLYAAGGGSCIDWKGELGTFQGLSETECGPAYGAGLELYGSEHVSFSASWLRYVDNSDFKATSYNLGFIWHFNWPKMGRQY